MTPDPLAKVLSGGTLDGSELAAVLEAAAADAFDTVRFGGLLTAVQMRGVTREELTGAARFLIRHAVPIDTGTATVTDIVGTGGDGGRSFNISTAAAFVAAGAGVRIAKHGNRAMSGRSGSADVMAAAGFNLACPPERMERAIADIGIGFLFAQRMHPVLAKVVPVRRALGVRTFFNLLGPLCNPAHATAAVIGVYDAALTELLAAVLRDLGMKRALIVHGADGLDEITVTDRTRMTELCPDGSLMTRDLYPELLFGRRYPAADLRGGTPDENAAVMRAVLDGRRRDGARAVVALNAGAAVYAAGLAESLEAGYAKACAAIDDGSALARLEALIGASHDA